MIRFVFPLSLMMSAQAFAGSTFALSYGGVGVLEESAARPESVVTVRGVTFPEEGVVGLGASLRAHGGPQGFDVGITPDLCVGNVGESTAGMLCGGLTLYSAGYRSGERTEGYLAPVVEPTFAFLLPGGESGAVFISAPVGYDIRYGKDGGWWGGVTLGFGALGGG